MYDIYSLLLHGVRSRVCIYFNVEVTLLDSWGFCRRGFRFSLCGSDLGLDLEVRPNRAEYDAGKTARWTHVPDVLFSAVDAE